MKKEWLEEGTAEEKTTEEDERWDNLERGPVKGGWTKMGQLKRG